MSTPPDYMLDLSSLSLQDAQKHIHTFFSNHSYTYQHIQPLPYQHITLSALHSHFMHILDALTDRIARVREARGALHIHIHNVSKEDIQMNNLQFFWNRIIPYNKYFEYQLTIYVHS